MGRVVRGRARAWIGVRSVGAVVSLAVLVVGGAACTPAPATGGDLEVTEDGGTLGSPSGEVWAGVKNVGTAVLEGRTTVVAEVASGPLRFTYATFFAGGAPSDTGGVTIVGPEISPDGKTLTLHLDGPQVLDVQRQVRVYFTDNFFMQPSIYTITFVHPDDVDSSNNSITIPRPPSA